MIYPKFITPGDIIGVTAPSCGITDEPGKRRFLNAKNHLEKEGYQVAFTKNVFETLEDVDVSSTAEERARQLGELICNDRVGAVFSAAGGTYLAEMLQDVDFLSIAKHPKWIQGYSDNTSLLYILTTGYDVATSYGNNFGEFGMQIWEKHVTDNFLLLSGKTKVQSGFSFHEGKRDFSDDTEKTGLEGHDFTEPVFWKTNTSDGKAQMQGRLIGGCLDVLLFLAGTRYDHTLEFLERYKDDGIIWYFETFLANADDLSMHLWKLKEMGWFRYTKGIVFGRPLMFESWSGKSYQETVSYMLRDVSVPMIFDADFGHVAPRMTMINGALASVSCAEGNGKIEYNFSR